jgi:hypothetical protein
VKLTVKLIIESIEGLSRRRDRVDCRMTVELIVKSIKGSSRL